MRIRADVAALLRQGLTNAEIGRRLHVDRHAVARARKALGLPNAPIRRPEPEQPETLEEAWRARTRPADGGHLEWTGSRQSTSGTPVLRYRGKTYTAARIAFRIRTGRDPNGPTKAECGMQHCVAPEHVDDTATRQRDRHALRAITGMGARPERCPAGHDQAVHGRYSPTGVSYCEACKACRRARR